MLIDLHIHSQFSFDSREKTENYISEAHRRGVPVIGFSEHYDYDAILDGESITPCAIGAYLGRLNELQSKDKSTEILKGIEFGYRDISVAQYSHLIAEHDFDYVINSVHTLPQRGDCFHDRFFAGRSLKESYRDYFKAVLESVYADFDFQIIGHIGYVSRYRDGENSKIRYEDYSDIMDEILTSIINRDKCLEVNTSTGKAGGLSLPDTDIIERYIQLGGKKLSFGSDAHCVSDYLRKSSEAERFLKSIGVEELYFYRRRKPLAYKI